jgi:glutathione S-transferase
MMKVYVQRPDQFFYYTVKMTADYCSVPIETVFVDSALAENADFKAKKGSGKFPFAELADGTILRESSAIAYYIARSVNKNDYVGTDVFTQARISQCIDFANSTLVPCLYQIAYNTFGHIDDKAGYTKAVADMKNNAKLLNGMLKDQDWFVGGRLTLADVVIFNTLILPFAFVFDAGFRKAMPDISSWFEKMSKLPIVARTAGYCKMVGAGAPAKGAADAGGKKGGKADNKAKGGDKKK